MLHLFYKWNVESVVIESENRHPAGFHLLNVTPGLVRLLPDFISRPGRRPVEVRVSAEWAAKHDCGAATSPEEQLQSATNDRAAALKATGGNPADIVRVAAAEDKRTGLRSAKFVAKDFLVAPQWGRFEPSELMAVQIEYHPEAEGKTGLYGAVTSDHISVAGNLLQFFEQQRPSASYISDVGYLQLCQVTEDVVRRESELRGHSRIEPLN
jgi:hypothetical protein